MVATENVALQTFAELQFGRPRLKGTSDGLIDEVRPHTERIREPPRGDRLQAAARGQDD